MISCITDGDHDDGLTSFAELAAAGVVGEGGGVGVSRHGTKSTNVGERERDRDLDVIGGSPFVTAEERDGREQDPEERVAVDWGRPPALPDEYSAYKQGR